MAELGLLTYSGNPCRSEHEIPGKGKGLSQSPELRHWTIATLQAPGRAGQVLPLVRSAQLPCRQAQLDCAGQVVAIYCQELFPTLCCALDRTPGRVSGMGLTQSTWVYRPIAALGGIVTSSGSVAPGLRSSGH